MIMHEFKSSVESNNTLPSLSAVVALLEKYPQHVTVQEEEGKIVVTSLKDSKSSLTIVE